MATTPEVGSSDPCSATPSGGIARVSRTAFIDRYQFQSSNLDEDYRLAAGYNHYDWADRIREMISAGKLDTSHQLPDFFSFVDELVALEPVYQAMEAEGWEPETVFVPDGFSPQQWFHVLSGYTLEDGNKTQGVWGNYYQSTALSEGRDDGSVQWDLAIISGSQAPALLDVSPDGQQGNSVEEVHELLEELSFSTAEDEVELIRHISPSHPMYYALQLNRLARGERPVDMHSSTIAQEDMLFPEGPSRALFLSWDTGVHRVDTFSDAMDYVGSARHEPASGVRPAVTGKAALALTQQ